MIIKRDYIKCGEGCGERPILSTKYGESLPLRHHFSRRHCEACEAGRRNPIPCVSLRQPTPALISHLQLGLVLKILKVPFMVSNLTNNLTNKLT